MTFKTLTGSMKFYYQSRNKDCPVTKQPAVAMMLEGCLRNAAKGREKVKKATVLEEDEVKQVLKKAFWGNDRDKELQKWRTATRLYTYFITLCRFDCYSKLTRDSFEFNEDYLTIYFKSAKNDQHYNGSTSILQYTHDELCPKLIYSTYFKMMKITEPDDKLNCKLGLNGKTARTKTLFSYTSSLKDTKDLLTEHGFTGVSEKSFKASGVSALLDKKTSLSDVQVILIALPFPFYSDSKFPKSRFMEDGKPHKQCYIIMILQSQEGKKSRMFYLPNNLISRYGNIHYNNSLHQQF